MALECLGLWYWPEQVKAWCFQQHPGCDRSTFLCLSQEGSRIVSWKWKHSFTSRSIRCKQACVPPYFWRHLAEYPNSAQTRFASKHRAWQEPTRYLSQIVVIFWAKGRQCLYSTGKIHVAMVKRKTMIPSTKSKRFESVLGNLAVDLFCCRKLRNFGSDIKWGILAVSSEECSCNEPILTWCVRSGCMLGVLGFSRVRGCVVARTGTQREIRPPPLPPETRRVKSRSRKSAPPAMCSICSPSHKYKNSKRYACLPRSSNLASLFSCRFLLSDVLALPSLSLSAFSFFPCAVSLFLLSAPKQWS